MRCKCDSDDLNDYGTNVMKYKCHENHPKNENLKFRY